MRRVKKSEGLPPGDSKLKPWSAEDGVQRFHVSTGELLQYGPTWLGWDDPIDLAMLAGTLIEGSICKIIPPANIPESQVAVLERELFKRGARQVRVMPAEPADKVKAEAPEPAQAAPNRSLRQVAVERANRVVGSHDKDALIALVNAAMDFAEGG